MEGIREGEPDALEFDTSSDLQEERGISVDDRFPLTFALLCSPSASVDLESVLSCRSYSIPRQLPPRPYDLPSVELDQLLLRVDPILASVPPQYILEKLAKLGPSLLEAANASRIYRLPDFELSNFTVLPCDLRSPSPLPLASPSRPSSPTFDLSPTHILAITAGESVASQPVLLLPVHGLIWAAHCAALIDLSATSTTTFVSSSRSNSLPHPLSELDYPLNTQNGHAYHTVDLPLVPFELPGSRALPLLQSWIHLMHPQQLLQSLLLPNIMQASVDTLLDYLSVVYELWVTAVLLQVNDKGLWGSMETAWEVLVAALGVSCSIPGRCSGG